LLQIRIRDLLRIPVCEKELVLDSIMKNRKLLILGNGPSLKKELFPFFRNFPCLGMNAAYRYWETIAWYPDIYCCLDDQVVLTHAEAIVRMAREQRCRAFLLHVNILDIYPNLAKIKGVWFLPQLCPGDINRRRCEERGLAYSPSTCFRSDNPSKLTTGSYSVRFAARMGFRQIGLIGTDCRYVEIIDGARALDGIVLEIEHQPQQNPNYFFDDYQQDGDRYNIPNPSVHGGNLHLDSFEVLSRDVRRYMPQISITLCTRESELYDRQVFPFTELRSFLHAPELSGVFVPCTAGQLDTLGKNMQRWRSRDFQPYDEGKQPEKLVGLHFALNAKEDADIEQRIRDVFKKNGLERWFDGPHFHWSGLEGERDRYTRDFSGKAGPEGFMAGPNNQFIDIVMKFSRGMSHIMLLEPDAVPVRAGWLSRMMREVESGSRFWICGSPYRGCAAIKMTQHINGNALYHVGDPAFREFIETELLPYFYERMKSAPHLCYDILLEDMFMPVLKGKADAALLERWKKTASCFRYSEFIADVSHVEDREEENLLDTTAARKRYPDAYLFHGAVSKMLEEPVSRLEDVRQDASNALAQVIFVDPDCQTYVGHFMAYNQKLTATLINRGYSVRVLCHEGIDEKILKRYDYYRPCLTFRSWDVGSRKNDMAACLLAESELFMSLAEIQDEGKALLVYMYLGCLEMSLVFRHLLESGIHAHVHMNLFWADQKDYGSLAYISRWREHVLWLDENRKKITVTAPTVQVQRDMQDMFGVTFDVARHPGTTFSDAELERLSQKDCTKPAESAHIIFPGTLRPEKGAQLTVEAARVLCKREIGGRAITCSIRNITSSNEQVSYQWEFSSMPTGVTVVQGELEDAAYKDMLLSGHVAVLPYFPSAFSKRTSGLLIDAIYARIPCIVIKDTWLAELVEHYGCGVVLDQPDAESVAVAVEHILNHYDEMVLFADRAACDYARRHSWETLGDAITAQYLLSLERLDCLTPDIAGWFYEREPRLRKAMQAITDELRISRDKQRTEFFVEKEVRRFNESQAYPRDVIIFGTSGYCDLVLKYLDCNRFHVLCFFDNDSSRWGSIKHDREIREPAYVENVVVLIASSWIKQIVSQLVEQLGYMPSEIYTFEGC
jgi:glycosyltransferase involved in cell wall biosynthesis